jgi:hypothetical protein
MNIQEISLSNNQKKKLQRLLPDESVLFQDDNGDLVVNVAAYMAIQRNQRAATIEDIVGKDILDFDSEFFVFN